jgi:hypothetical protein
VAALLESDPRQGSACLIGAFSSRVLKISGASASVHLTETSVGTFTTRMSLRRTGKALHMAGLWQLHLVEVRSVC